MKLSQVSIARPVTTIVGALLVAIFGIVAIGRLPIQMKPTIDKPIIRINTTYLGAAPPEVEEQITDKLEERVNAVEGLKKMSSVSGDSFSNIELEFEWGVNRDARFVDVLQKVNLAEDLPEDAEKPVISVSSSVDEERIMWIMLRSDTMSVEEMSFLANNDIKDTLQRIEGVGDVGVYGKREREISVILDPEALTARRLTVAMVRQAILNENRNVRGGYIDEGKKRFNVRTIGQFTTVAEMKRMVVARRPVGNIYLEDIARVEDSYELLESVVRGNADPMIALGVARKLGANVVAVTEQLEQAVARLNKRFASFTYKGRRTGLKLTPAYRESDYIWDSLYFVSQNLVAGSLLAVAVLIFFLKSLRSTFVVAMVIPICFISIFIFLQIFDRTINIISLAGIAFAIGMTVDNAIVVIENIYRHMEMGKTRAQAALDGAVEVWGAILASTLTTIAVFLPVLYIKEESGQLFRDIALTISFSVAMSLVLSLTLIPMLSARLLKMSRSRGALERIITIVFWIPDHLGWIIAGFFNFSVAVVTGKYTGRLPQWLRLLLDNMTKIGIVALIMAFSLVLAWINVPPLEYLPTGNRNIILVFYKVHPELNIHKSSEISLGMEQKIMGMLFEPSQDDVPENRVVERMFAVVTGRFKIIGVILKQHYAQMPVSKLPQRVHPWTGRPFTSAIDYIAFRIGSSTFGTPGTQFTYASKIGLFTFSGKNFEIEIRGPSIKRLEQLAADLKTKIGAIGQKAGFGRIVQDFEVGLPEIRVAINREKAAELGLKTSEVAEVVEALIAGVKTGKFREGSEEIDIVVRGDRNLLADIVKLKQTTFVIPERGSTTLESVADIYLGTGPTQIYHKERERAITLQVNLPDEKPLEQAIAEVAPTIDNLRKSLPAEYSIAVTGQASDLDRTVNAFIGSFILSIIVTYLLMASLFESFFYPLIIMVTVPLAISGSIFAVNFNEVPMDMLTVLGFIILCGIVVNNAILVVHQSLNFQAQGMEAQKSIRESVRSRLRPVFMSTITTVFGLLPMCIKGSPGSELYSGLGTAIIGGLLFSTLFTLIMVPALLSLLVDVKKLFGRIWRLGAGKK